MYLCGVFYYTPYQKREYMELVLKDLQTKIAIPINNSDELELAVINIMAEHKYTKERMAEFFGLRERAFYYKKNKLMK